MLVITSVKTLGNVEEGCYLSWERNLMENRVILTVCADVAIKNGSVAISRAIRRNKVLHTSRFSVKS